MSTTQDTTQEIMIQGRKYQNKDGWISMDRNDLKKIPLTEIPIGVKICNPDKPVEFIESAGLLVNVDGKIDVLVRIPTTDLTETPLADEQYNEAVNALIWAQEESAGNVKVVKENALDSGYTWIAISVQGDSVDKLFSDATNIAEKIFEPLLELESEIIDRIDAFGKK
jgi:hypothetical protein